MALLDANLQFSNAQVVTATAASTGTLDLASMTMKTTTFTPGDAGNIGPNQTYFGEDLGIGSGRGEPRVTVEVGVAMDTLTTLQLAFQGAPDNATAHASGNISDLTFVTFVETGTIALALLTAGARIWSVAWPKRKIAAALSRFVRLNYTVVGSSNVAGTINADVGLGGDDAQDTLIQYGSGYTVGA